MTWTKLDLVTCALPVPRDGYQPDTIYCYQPDTIYCYQPDTIYYVPHPHHTGIVWERYAPQTLVAYIGGGRLFYVGPCWRTDGGEPLPLASGGGSLVFVRTGA
jgi:hypothetical protein